jgi:hypothetical protein
MTGWRTTQWRTTQWSVTVWCANTGCLTASPVVAVWRWLEGGSWNESS